MPPLQAMPILLWATLLFSIKVSFAAHSSSPNSRESHHHVARARVDQVPLQVDLQSRGVESAEGTSPATSTHQKRDEPINPGFDYARQKIRGVNIGGWLVTEPWVTPSLYNTGNSQIIDEYTFCEQLGRSEATKRLRAHWGSFYKEGDFHTIKSYGLNHVRIPIGYWAFDISAGEPYVQGQFEYLKKGVEWARRAGLKVMIDLHGAPGSQNGFDNSGRKGPINWATDPNNLVRTKQALAKLAKEFTQSKYAGTVTSLEALNEPAGFANDGHKTLNAAKQYYYDGYTIVRHPNAQGPQSNVLYAIHDAFQPLDTWSTAFPPAKYQGLALDTHIYTVFDSSSLRKNDDARVATYCRMADGFARSNSAIWTFVGEFTPAPTDCAPRLNGQGTGARYDGTFPDSKRLGSCQGKSGSARSFSKEYKTSLARFFEVQTTVYEKASGWFMWTFKAENADDWSYDAGVKGGWIPRDPGFKAHGNPCS